MINKIKLYYKKYGEITAFCIGIFGLFFGLFQYFNPYTSKAELKYFLRENIDVISIRQNLEALRIYYNEKDIRRDSLNLQMLRVRLRNTGANPVFESDYASIPFGIRVKDGSLVSVKYTSEDEYLKNTFKVSSFDSSKVLFSKCVFDPDEFVDIELLLIHKRSEFPSLEALGKIAGIEKIGIDDGSDEETDWIGFSISMIAIILILGVFLLLPIYLISWIVDVTQRFFRRRSILKFYDYPLNQLSEEQRQLSNLVVKVGRKKLIKIFQSILDNSGIIDGLYQKELRNKKTVDEFRKLIEDKIYTTDNLTGSKVKEYQTDQLFVYEELIAGNLVNKPSLELKEIILNEMQKLSKAWV